MFSVCRSIPKTCISIICFVALIIMAKGCAPVEETKVQTKPVNRVEVKIEGIMYSTQNPSAIVNGEQYRIGDMFDDYTIVRIYPEKVTLEFQGAEKDYAIGETIFTKLVKGPLPEKSIAGKTATVKPYGSGSSYPSTSMGFRKFYSEAKDNFSLAESYFKKSEKAKARLYGAVSGVGYADREISEAPEKGFEMAYTYYEKAELKAQNSRETEKLSESENQEMLSVIERAREQRLLVEAKKNECIREREDAERQRKKEVAQYQYEGTSAYGH